MTANSDPLARTFTAPELMTMHFPEHCAVCDRPIGKASTRYLIRQHHVVCTMCIFNDRTPERTRELHALAAPECGIAWHDHWDHFERFVSGPREAVERMLTTYQEATR